MLIGLLLIVFATALQVWGEIQCSELVKEGEVFYIAATSDERGYYVEDNHFIDNLYWVVHNRAEEICKLSGCGKLKEEPKTATIDKAGYTIAKIPRNTFLQEEEFLLKAPWKYTDDGHKISGNFYWYLGHALAYITTAGILKIWDMPDYVTVLIPAGAVFLSQTVTMFSRKWERSDPKVIKAEEALRRIHKKQKVHKIYLADQKRVPHLVFSSIQCHEPSFKEFEVYSSELDF